VSTDEQLQWEARLGRPAAAAAIAAGVLLLAGTIVLFSIPEDRRGVEPRPDFLLSVNDSPGSLIAATAMQAVAALCLILVFYYLFRAILHRGQEIPRWFVYLVFIGPAMYAVAQLLSAFTQIDAAEVFAAGDSTIGDDCPQTRGEVGADCASDILEDKANPAAIALGLAGTVGTAFLFVMVPLRARRVGLLSPFMSILGVIAGVLFVLPILPGVPVVLQAFWLGAIGALYLGSWPGAAERANPEPEPPPERPSSRKRRRKNS
jgi:hypothetical protein